MKASTAVFTIFLIGCFSLAFLIIAACEEQDDYRKVPLMNDDGTNYAKDKDEDIPCDLGDYFIQDCYDACTCCYFDGGEILENCVRDCNETLIRYQDYPPAHTDVDNYKECVVGCWSVCDKPDKKANCWNDCNQYIENAD
jgi:hypothetical protein